MDLSYKFIPKSVFLLVISAIILLAGCTNPADSGEEEHHPHPIGAVLKMNGTEIVRAEGGVVSDSIGVSAGEETPLITIHFLDEEGTEFQPDEPDFSLRWDQIDTAIAEIEQHNGDGKWSFTVHGVAQGNTTVRLRLWHEVEEHSDFETPPITITVN